MVDERDLFYASAAWVWAYVGHLESGMSLRLEGILMVDERDDDDDDDDFN